MTLNPPRHAGSTCWLAWSLSVVTLVSFVGAVAGCSDGRPKRVAISGVVTVDGEPVPAGEIMFVPEGTRPSSSEIGSDGRFTLRCFDGGDGAVLGVHRVQISACQYTQSGANWYAPKKYADFRTSNVTYEVTGADNDIVIELTWDGEKRPKKRR